VLEAVARPASDQPDVRPLRMAIDEEVPARRVLVLADAGLEQRSRREGGEAAGQEGA
jgi:hypothetical protein